MARRTEEEGKAGMIWSAEFRTRGGLVEGPQDEDSFYDLVDALGAWGATSVVGGWEDNGTALSARFCVETAFDDMRYAFDHAYEVFVNALEKAGLPQDVAGGEVESFDAMAARQDREIPELFSA